MEQIRVASAVGGGPSAVQLLSEEGDKISFALQIWTKWAQGQKEQRMASRAVTRWLRLRCYALIGSLIELDETSCFDARIAVNE